MLNYEEFREVLEIEFENYFPEELKNCLVYRTVTKVNEELDAISLCTQNKTMTVGPTVYINDLYGEYRKTNNLEQLLSQISKVLLDNIDCPLGVSELNKEYVKKNVFIQLINTKRNANMLKNTVHRNYLDLSIIYRVAMNINGGSGSFIIQQPLAQQYGLAESELYKLALKNTVKITPFTISGLEQIVAQICREKDFTWDLDVAEIENNSDDFKMYVVSNANGNYGANAMVIPEILEEIADKTGGDYYILPSSLHEIIAIPAAFCDDVNQLWDMVKEVNTNHVATSDILSYSVYKYMKDLKEVVIAERTNWD